MCGRVKSDFCFGSETWFLNLALNGCRGLFSTCCRAWGRFRAKGTHTVPDHWQGKTRKEVARSYCNGEVHYELNAKTL
eukprot:4019946-Amphidinium_carterae.1